MPRPINRLVQLRSRRSGGRANLGHGRLCHDWGTERYEGAPGDVATPGLIPEAPAVIDRIPVAVAAKVIAVALVRTVEVALVVTMPEGLGRALVRRAHALALVK